MPLVLQTVLRERGIQWRACQIWAPFGHLSGCSTLSPGERFWLVHQGLFLAFLPRTHTPGRKLSSSWRRCQPCHCLIGRLPHTVITASFSNIARQPPETGKSFCSMSFWDQLSVSAIQEVNTFYMHWSQGRGFYTKWFLALDSQVGPGKSAFQLQDVREREMV